MVLTKVTLVENEEKMHPIDQGNKSIVLEQNRKEKSGEKFLYPVVATMTGAAYETKKERTSRA